MVDRFWRGRFEIWISLLHPGAVDKPLLTLYQYYPLCIRPLAYLKRGLYTKEIFFKGGGGGGRGLYTGFYSIQIYYFGRLFGCYHYTANAAFCYLCMVSLLTLLVTHVSEPFSTICAFTFNHLKWVSNKGVSKWDAFVVERIRLKGVIRVEGVIRFCNEKNYHTSDLIHLS